MIRIESGGIGTLFDGLARQAIEKATSRSRQTFFYWNSSDLVIAEPDSTVEGLLRQLREREAARKALSQKFRLERKKGETSEDYVNRGLALAVDQEAEVTIKDSSGGSSAWLDLHPWTRADIAMLEWQARLAS